MSKRNKKINRQKKHPRDRRRKAPTLENLEVDKNLGIAVIPTMYSDTQGIRLASQTYEITQQDGLVVVLDIPFDTFARISNLLTLLRGATGSDKLFTSVPSTWPQQWNCLTDEQLQYIESIGIPVQSQSQRLMDSLQIAFMPKWFYFGKNADILLDSWLEVIWQEYIIECEILRYTSLPKQSKSKNWLTHQSLVEFRRAEAWIALENCAVRIRSIWDRIHKYLIPLYFTGELPTSESDYWRNLDTSIRSLLSEQPELELYNHVFNFITNDILGHGTNQKTILKTLRDNLIHNLSHRPEGVAPPKSTIKASLPNTPDEFYQLILNERDRTRELIIITAAIMWAKEPTNPELSSDVARISS